MQLTRKKSNDGAEPAAKEPKAPKAPKAPKPPKAPKEKKPKDKKERKKKSSGSSVSAEGKKAKGARRFVMIVGDDGAIVVFLHGNTVVRRLFAPSPQPDHVASIAELMRSNPKVPLVVLADVLDQQYVRHTFPPVSSLSVKGLVERRLERDFQAEDLKGFMPLGRDKTGRKEWNYLLIALASTPLMQQWLEFIVELPNELKGIYLTPIEGQNYIPALQKAIGEDKHPWQLLVSHNKVSGFRQIVLRDGKLVFSRVTQAIDDGVAAVIAGNIEQEIINTIEYLRRLGFPDNSKLDIIVITAQEVKETIDLKRFNAGSAAILTPLDVADMLNLQQAALSADRFGDVVMAAWFARAKKRSLRFMTAYALQLGKLYTARRAAVALGALAAIGMIGMAVMNVTTAISTGSEAENIERARAPLQSETAQLQKSLEGLDKNVAYKSAIVGVHDAYLKDAPKPLDFVALLAPYITANQRVTDIVWGPPGAVGANGTAPSTYPSEVRISMEFLGQYADVETLTLAADAFVGKLKKEITAYDIQVAPYSWMSNSANGMEISFDAQKTASANETNHKIELIFTGPKPAAPDAGGAPPPGTM